MQTSVSVSSVTNKFLPKKRPPRSSFPLSDYGRIGKPQDLAHRIEGQGFCLGPRQAVVSTDANPVTSLTRPSHGSAKADCMHPRAARKDWTDARSYVLLPMPLQRVGQRYLPRVPHGVYIACFSTAALCSSPDDAATSVHALDIPKCEHLCPLSRSCTHHFSRTDGFLGNTPWPTLAHPSPATSLS